MRKKLSTALRRRQILRERKRESVWERESVRESWVSTRVRVKWARTNWPRIGFSRTRRQAKIVQCKTCTEINKTLNIDLEKILFLLTIESALVILRVLVVVVIGLLLLLLFTYNLHVLRYVRLLAVWPAVSAAKGKDVAVGFVQIKRTFGKNIPVHDWRDKKRETGEKTFNRWWIEECMGPCQTLLRWRVCAKERRVIFI